MRLLIGSDIGNYTFDPVAKQIKFLDVPYNMELKNIFSVFNINTGSMVYSFAKSGYGGTISNNTLTLDSNTSGMDETDELLIIVDIPQHRISSDIVDSIKKLAVLLTPLSVAVDRSTNRSKGSVIIESGTVTTCTTCTTCTTLGNIGSFAGNSLAFIASNNMWSANVGRRFT